MKLGINEATCMHNSDLMLDLQLCEEFGYDFIEIRLDLLAAYLEEHSWEELENFFSTSHVQPAGYNSIEDINFSTAAEWEEKLRLIDFACEASRRIGGDQLVVVPTVAEKIKWNKAKVHENSVKVLREMAERTAPCALKLAFEPIGSASCCVQTLQEAYAIVKEVSLPEVGLVVDAFNLYLSGEWKDFEMLKKIPTDKIFIYHIDDADDLPVELLDHCHRLFPGNGVISLASISSVLQEKGYDGICSLELFNPSYWELEARQVFKVGKEKTQQYL